MGPLVPSALLLPEESLDWPGDKETDRVMLQPTLPLVYLGCPLAVFIKWGSSFIERSMTPGASWSLEPGACPHVPCKELLYFFQSQMDHCLLCWLLLKCLFQLVRGSSASTLPRRSGGAQPSLPLLP